VPLASGLQKPGSGGAAWLMVRGIRFRVGGEERVKQTTINAMSWFFLVSLG